MDLSISIISTNEKHFLDVLLPQIPVVAAGLDFEVILIDNASSDGTSGLAESYPFVKIIRNKDKKNFCTNHNMAIEESLAKYILLLNPDINFDASEPCLKKMFDFMELHPDCGISGCRVYNFDKMFAYPARNYQTISIAIGRRIPYLSSKRLLDGYLYKEYDINSTFETDWLSGCFLFTRKSMFKSTGLLDEGFEKYFEDVDICQRAHATGWKVIYNGETFYYHLEQRASKNLFSMDAIKHLKSWIRWKRKQKYYLEQEKLFKKVQ
jgi:N-acetylglucosaminyl-diphospho-decaprenol L-rhamnosyltransferase